MTSPSSMLCLLLILYDYKHLLPSSIFSISHSALHAFSILEEKKDKSFPKERYLPLSLFLLVKDKAGTDADEAVKMRRELAHNLRFTDSYAVARESYILD